MAAFSFCYWLSAFGLRLIFPLCPPVYSILRLSLVGSRWSFAGSQQAEDRGGKFRNPERKYNWPKSMNEIVSKYARLSDGELLQLASDRGSLTQGAAAALDAEMTNRKLTHVDVQTHERFVRQGTQREARRRRRKLFGSSRSSETLGDGLFTVLGAVLAIALIWIAYVALPARYHFSPDWEQTAMDVMFPSVFIAVASSFWWRRIAFWISLAVSTTIHAVLLHMWVVHFGAPSGRSEGRLAVLLGIVLFVVVYGCLCFVGRKSRRDGIVRQ